MLKQFIILGMFLGIVGLLFITQLTTPATIHPIGILAVFICIYLLVLAALTFLIVGISRVYARGLAIVTAKHYLPLGLSTAYQYATVLALGPVIMLAMRTVGSLNASDVLFVVIFVGLACFYVWRRR